MKKLSIVLFVIMFPLSVIGAMTVVYAIMYHAGMQRNVVAECFGKYADKEVNLLDELLLERK